MNTHLVSTNWWGVKVYVSADDFKAVSNGLKTASELDLPYEWLKQVIFYASHVANIVAMFLAGKGVYLTVTWTATIIWAWPG